MTRAPQGACSGRAPPSLRSPPAKIIAIHYLEGLTERSGHNYSERLRWLFLAIARGNGICRMGWSEIQV